MDQPRTTPSPEAAFESVVSALIDEPDVEEGTGFGTNPGLRTRSKIFAMLHSGELVVKLPPDRCSELTAAGRAEAFEIGRKKMREWVTVAEVDQAQWLRLAGEARSYVNGL